MRGIETLESRRLFSAGALDLSFGSGGSVITTLGTVNELASGQIIAQKDGKIVAVGYGSSGGVSEADLLRFNANGTPDATFGVDGKITIESGGNLVENLAVGPDGSIYVGMQNANGTPPPLSTSVVFRYTPSGQLDSTFASGGELTLAPYVTLRAMAVKKDGTLLLVSRKETNPGGVSIFGIDPSEIVLQQYTIAGTPDSHFGTNGETDTQIGAEDLPNAIAVQRDGKVIVAGFSSDGIIVGSAADFVARYKTDGTLDPTYGTNGVFSASTLNPQSIALDSNGKVLLTGKTVDNQIAVERLTRRGRVDSSFGKKGVALIPTDEQLVNADTSIAIEASGKIVVGTQQTIVSVGSQTILTKLNANGKLDRSFGHRGMLSTSFDNPGTTTAVAESKGHLLVAEDVNIGTIDTVKQLVIVAYKK